MSLLPDAELQQLEITDLTLQGRSIARYMQRVLFLDQGLPGEVVDARVTKVKKNVAEGVVTAFHRYSPDRQSPWCPDFGRCGGCMWQHFAPNATLEWKRRHVEETLARIGKIRGIPVHAVTPSPAGRAYRNKMAFAFGPDEQGAHILLGLRKFHSRDIVEVAACGILPARALALVERVRAFLHEYAKSEEAVRTLGAYLRFLVLHMPDHAQEGEQLLVECITGAAHSRTSTTEAGSFANAEFVSALGDYLCRGDTPTVTGFIHSERKDSADVAQGEKKLSHRGKTWFSESFDGLVLERIPYSSFVQTNTGAATALYKSVRQEARLTGSEVVWDMYSGVGGIALFLAGEAREVHGFEANKDAVSAARRNAHALGFEHCSFHAGRIGKNSPARASAPDIVVVDPPRAGLDREALDMLLSSPARTLLYVSCDAGTLARDASLLAHSWVPVSCRPVDMFPFTPHVESLMTFHRK